MSYIDKVDKRIKKYYDILEKDYPTWLNDYIDTKEMLKQQYISVSCGTIYSDLFENNFFYSSLDHSIGVALIVWHFTHDKKQTLSGLFHDIATPSFKHCVDFMNGDYITQESTEDLTTYFIKNSKEIMSLLERDNISIEEVDDYHKYKIADNDTPKLSSDRLEYSLSNALFIYKILDINSIREIYNDIEIQKNEEGEIELGFRTLGIARKFVEITSKMSVFYRDDKTRYSMQLIADILKKLSDDNKITKKDLYELKEREIINIITSSKYNDIFDIWKKSEKVKTSINKPKNVYYFNNKVKVRYIDPIVNGERISKICKTAKKSIDKNLSYNMDKYVYIDGISLPK